MGLLKWAWIPGIPLLWDLIVTLTASWRRSSPATRSWATGRSTTSTATLWTPARRRWLGQDIGQLHAVVRNTFIQGTLSIIFAVVVIVVVAAAVVMAVRAIRGGGRPLAVENTHSVKAFRSSHLLATPAEKEVQKEWDALDGSTRQIGWYVGALMGDSHYQRYVAHRALVHPGER